MKPHLLISVLILFLGHSVFAQNIVEQLKEFYANADLDCYQQKIQKDLRKYDSTVVSLLPKLETMPHSPVRPGNIDLSTENKVFVLAVTLANTENYNFEDNIYDYLIIDSLRTFIIVCVDEKQNVIGLTDTEEPGSWIDVKDDFYFPKRKRRKQIQKSLRNINREKPDMILYCDAFWSSLLYIKGDKIYAYDLMKDYAREFNEEVRRCPDINMIRRSNFILWPLQKGLELGSHLIEYRPTGHTPQNEVRICSSSTY